MTYSSLPVMVNLDITHRKESLGSLSQKKTEPSQTRQSNAAVKRETYTE